MKLIIVVVLLVSVVYAKDMKMMGTLDLDDGTYGCFDGFCRGCTTPGARCTEATGKFDVLVDCKKQCGWGCFDGTCLHCRYADCTGKRVYSTFAVCWDRRCQPNALYDE